MHTVRRAPYDKRQITFVFRIMMNQQIIRWSRNTVIAQSLFLFFITALVLVTPHLWHDTYAYRLEGQALPALTEWILDTLPSNSTAVLCLSVSIALTHLCVGIAFVTTAPNDSIAIQRTSFFTTLTWSTTLTLTLIILLAQALPFISVMSRLTTAAEAQAQRLDARTWIVWTALYCAGVIALTTLLYRKKTSLENKP